VPGGGLDLVPGGKKEGQVVVKGSVGKKSVEKAKTNQQPPHNVSSRIGLHMRGDRSKGEETSARTRQDQLLYVDEATRCPAGQRPARSHGRGTGPGRELDISKKRQRKNERFSGSHERWRGG